ncbi:MAG: hypothetical protein FWF26_03910 [Treponema sp.]|nr:hypothetical protein [Treponema sp.]
MDENITPQESIGTPEKILCLVAYVFSLPGVIIVRIAGRKNRFCLQHARRSLELFLFMLFLMILWYIVTYILMLIPYGGFPVAMALFGLVTAAAVFVIILCLAGIINVLRGKTIVFPFITSFFYKIEGLFKFVGLPE